MNYSDTLYRGYEKISSENVKLKERIFGYQEKCHKFQQQIKQLESSKEKIQGSYDKTVAEKDAIIKELRNQLAHMAAVAAHDGSNTGIPTAATPLNKKKVIPNSRRGSGKNRGGQKYHPKHTMPSFVDEEVTATEHHELDLELETCDYCNGELIDTGDVTPKDEFDVEIKVVKKRHEYHIYQCADCGREVRQQISKRLKEKNQYGGSTQAIALSLMNTGNVAINKVRMLLSGMTGEMLAPCEGYIAKLQHRAAAALENFVKDLKIFLIQRTLLYWDETVIMINTSRACLRFYGDETLSFYTAHAHKDLDSIEADHILDVLTKDTVVMHDHNRVNYNKKFSFQNIECNQHLQRDLQKASDDNPGHTWSGKLKGVLSETIKERKEMIAEGKGKFSEKYIQAFNAELNNLLKKGRTENDSSKCPYGAPFENTLLIRIEKYRENYFKWIENFSLPTTDNLSERGLRCVKSHMKISGQFYSEKTAGYFAAIKTYVETCRKNSLNEMEALKRLCEGAPYTVEEIFGKR